MAAEWSVAQRESGEWSVERLEATAPVGHLSAVVPDSTQTAKIEGELDLPALFHQLPRALSFEGLSGIETGAARFSAVAAPRGQGSDWTLDASITDVAWRSDGQRHQAPPVSLTGRAAYQPDAGRLDLTAVDLSTRYGAIHGTAAG